MFRESIIVRQMFFGFLLTFMVVGGLRAEAFEGGDRPIQTHELMAEGDSIFYSSAQAEQTLELQVRSAGILLLESDHPEGSGNGPTLVGALQSRGGAHWIRQQGAHLSLAFTRAGIHRLQVIQGGLPEALQGVFVPTPIRSRHLQMPTSRGLVNVEQMELLDPADGSVWVGVLEMRDPQGGSRAANVDLSWTSERRRADSAEGDFIDTTMAVTLRQAGIDATWETSQNHDPHPPDDEVDPNPSGFMGGRGTWETSQNHDPHPPDDEVDPNPSGFMGGLGTWETSQNHDPHPPDDEVDPNPSGFMGGLGTWETSQNHDPHPPDDEVDPNPSGFGSSNGVVAQQLKLQLRNLGSTSQDDEALAVLVWLSNHLFHGLEAEAPSGVELRGVIF